MEQEKLVLEMVTRTLEAELLKAYGPLVTGDRLVQVLGYQNHQALTRAISMKKEPVSLFNIEGRKGKFAFTQDIARWLATLRIKHLKSEYNI